MKNALIFVLFLLSAAMMMVGIINDMPAEAAEQQEIPEAVTAEPARPAEPSKPPEHRPHAQSLGTFTLTAYCSCFECCGKFEGDPWYGITASGTEAAEGRTVAVDPEVIPLGSVLYINGERYVAEDTGGAIEGNHIDIYFSSHADALEFGVQEAEVFLFA